MTFIAEQGCGVRIAEVEGKVAGIENVISQVEGAKRFAVRLQEYLATGSRAGQVEIGI